MGTWFSAFFDNENEIASDVRNEYLDYLQAGMTGRSATRRLPDDFAEEFSEGEWNEQLFWMALAVTQWKYGRLEPRVKAKALRVIKQGGDLAAYPPERQQHRRNVLEKVRTKLESPQPPEKPIRISKPAEPLKKIERLWKPGQVVAFRRASGRFVLLLTEVVFAHDYSGQIPFFVILNWEGAKLPSPEKIRKLRSTDYVIDIYPDKKGAPVPWDRVERLDLIRDVTGLVRRLAGGVYCPTGMNPACSWDELDARLDDVFDALVPRRNRRPRS